MNTHTVYAAGVIIFTVTDTNEIRYLLLHNVKGHWDFAKGRFDAGETAIQAAWRELYEEAGLTTQMVELDQDFQEVVAYNVVYNDILYPKQVFYFLGKVWYPQVTLSNEHDAFGWYSLDEAKALLAREQSSDLLNKADAYIAAHYE